MMGTVHALGSAPPSTGEQHPLRILLAEDNPLNQEVARLFLEELGYEATMVSNGAEALQALEAAPFDVILMDVEMGVMDGIEATKRIRQGIVQSDIWIVALTANVLPEKRRRYAEAGMDDYLSKPINLTLLETALKRVVLRAPAPQAEAVTMRPGERAEEIDDTQLDSIRAIASEDSAFQSLVDEFLHGANALAERMSTALGESDAIALARAAHTLRGSASLFGATVLAGACHELEQNAATPEHASRLLHVVLARHRAMETAMAMHRRLTH